MNVIRLAESLPSGQTANVLARQLLRLGTSVSGNYRAACPAKFTRNLISKMGIVEEEADESILWMGLLLEAQKVRPPAVAGLMKEADELVPIAIASINTAGRSNAKAALAVAKLRTPRSALRTPRS